jgi:S-adenosylmethionine:tRNA ribosyltransferase-isomerase
MTSGVSDLARVDRKPQGGHDDSPASAGKGWPLSSLPESMIAKDPAEARGLARDEVRLLVTRIEDDSVVHTRFTHFPDFLRNGDVIVVNSSATINASLAARRPGGEAIELHLSQQQHGDRWVVELRRLTARGTEPLHTARAGETIETPAGGSVTLLSHYTRDADPIVESRLWLATVNAPEDYYEYLATHGFPIRYGYVPRQWPLAYHQTLFADTPGSAEMPSAGRPFSARVVDALTRKGVSIAPILLHTGVSSLEDHEPPYPEFYRVGAGTARLVNEARDRGGRVVAIGTTSVRALETVTDTSGKVEAGEGWTDLVITPDRGLNAVDAMLTGFHEPRASHLAMLYSLAGRAHVERAYAAAVRRRYLWHEFGDVHLVLPAGATSH